MARGKRAFILTVLILTPIMLLSSRAGSGAVGKSQRGENIFRAKCSICHGVDGGGQTETGKKFKAPDLRSDKVQNLSDEEMLASVMNGKGSMPPVSKKYSAAQLKQVIGYVRALGRKN